MVLAWRGVKVLHIHWTYNFSKSSDPLVGRLARWWFGVFLAAAQAAGLKIVWTAHNLLPHEPVFDNDMAARRVLVSRADAVIAMSPHSAREVTETFGVEGVAIIPLGPIERLESPYRRETARQALDIDHRTCFTYFGYLRPYKGVEVLIHAAERLGPQATVLIVGQGDPQYVATLERMVIAATAGGAVIRFDPRWHSDEELATVLAASDVSVFPFARVDNSGSILLAMVSGIPIVIPDLASLGHIDNPGVFRYDHSDPVHSLVEMMTKLSTMDADQRAALGDAAREWALGFDWHEIGRATNAVYAGTFREA
jgi:glycosyltransferase involved in cell wall biosynthesis